MIMVMLSLGLPRLPPRFTETVPPEELPLLVPAGEAGVCGLSGWVAVTGVWAPVDVPEPTCPAAS
jgi:hypothetical protein